MDIGESPLSTLSSELNKNLTMSGSPRRPKLGPNSASRGPSSKLLSSGLRVSTPPARAARRLQLVPDENNPPSPPLGCRRVPTEDLDLCSQDSGCAMSFSSSSDASSFKFLEPTTPKRLGSMESPRRCLTFSSENSVEDAAIHDILPDVDENTQFSSVLGSLLNGQILSERSPLASPMRYRRCSSETSTPLRSSEFSLKRPLRCTQMTTAPTKKKLKATDDDHVGYWESPPVKKPQVTSDSEITIKLALQRSTQEDLIGDFSRPFALPLTSGKHYDLKSITPDTLAKLINGQFDGAIESYKIIDCRYPYEYDGGHIRGAINLYTCDHITTDLLGSKRPTPSNERHILVFHCEFSKERAPFLTRYLRQEDRSGNEYPALHYPELYLLDGGYSNFFKAYGELCEPQSYRQMNDPAHTTEFKTFQENCKSKAPMNHKKQTIRSLNRLTS